MRQRVKILQDGCKVYSEYLIIIKNNDATEKFEKLKKLQTSVISGEINEKEIIDLNSENFSFVKDRLQFHSIMLLDKSKALACVAEKTGTTNWQRAFVPLIYDGRMADFSVHNTVGKSEIPIFTFIPRISSMFCYGYGWKYEQNKNRQKCIKDILKEKSTDPKYVRSINSRNGFYQYRK